jgi:hypothetical protein
VEVGYPTMRKRLFTPTLPGIEFHDLGWPDLDPSASVEVTSEEKQYPVESARSRRNAGLASRRFWHSSHSANLR